MTKLEEAKKFKSDDGVSEIDVDPKAKGKKKAKDKPTMKEALDNLFTDSDLSEEAKTKIHAIFEAAVQEAVEAKKKEIEEEVAAEWRQEWDELIENIDRYMDTIAEEWLQENEIAIEDSIKVEISESLLDGLKNLMTEHNIEIDADTDALIAEMRAEKEELEKKLNRALEESIKYKEELERKEVMSIVENVTKDMSEVTKTKFLKLAENITFEDTNELELKLKEIAETFNHNKTSKEDKYHGLFEEVENEEEQAEDISEEMKIYLKKTRELFGSNL